jgi:hypothetical protein
MGFLTMLGYTPLTREQEARYYTWQWHLRHRERMSRSTRDWADKDRARQWHDFWKTSLHDLETTHYGVTHRRRAGDFAPGSTIPTDDNAARFIARLETDPDAWIYAEIERFRALWEQEDAPKREAQRAQDAARRQFRRELRRKRRDYRWAGRRLGHGYQPPNCVVTSDAVRPRPEVWQQMTPVAFDATLEKDWLSLTPREFEHACADLLRKSGYVEIQVTPNSADGGIDVIASKDGRGFAVQCKRYQHPVGPEPVRALAGIVACRPEQFSGGGIFMTTNRFSRVAWREGQRAKLMMITGSELVAMAQAANAPTEAARAAGEGAA